MRLLYLFLALVLASLPAQASPEQAWRQAMSEASDGKLNQAMARLAGAEQVLPSGSLWKQRLQLARGLLQMRRERATELDRLGLQDKPLQMQLMRQYISRNPPPEAGSSLWPGLMAALFPGAGHALQGRWRDAAVAAALVWPMLILTLWAARRRMGPVTVFFALLTVWLWSGTVFSAVSLAERGALESYMLWWQGLWQAAALPGRPW